MDISKRGLQISSTDNSNDHYNEYDYPDSNSNLNQDEKGNLNQEKNLQFAKVKNDNNDDTATINVNYDGFSEEAKNAFEYAVNIWEKFINIDVPIQVNAYWKNLNQFLNRDASGILGGAMPYDFEINFPGATEDNTYYPISLANHLAGEDLNGDEAEIVVYLNSNLGLKPNEENSENESEWYFGTDGNTPNEKYDLPTVILHELVHGFGLTDDIYYDNGKVSHGNTIFEKFIVNGDDTSLSEFPNNSKELRNQLTSENLFFNGANAIEANGGEKPKLYAPSRWEYGSSVAHLDEKTYPRDDKDALMTPNFASGETIHNPGAITLGILEDLGWDINEVNIAPVVETPSTQPGIITFNESKVSSYAGQDKSSIFNISDNKQEVEIKENTWKKFALDYEITKKTILEFDFQSIIKGEIQGIGFDTDDKFGSNDDKRLLFQLSGTQQVGVSDFKDDVTGKGWKTYQIELGEYFTGDVSYLTFVNDHDGGKKNAHSLFRNIKIYEGNSNNLKQAKTEEDSDSELLLTVQNSTNNYNVFSYGGSTQDKATFTIYDDQKEIEIKDNGWKKLDINNYNIKENTVLKFEFQSTQEGEIQGIGFDNDDIINNGDRNHLFKVLGTQDWGIEIEDEYTVGSGWQTYTINVGQYFTGEFDYLTLANDDDANSKAQSQFRNISLYEM